MVLFETFVLEYLYSKQYQSREKLEIINKIRVEITCGPGGGGPLVHNFFNNKCS